MTRRPVPRGRVPAVLSCGHTLSYEVFRLVTAWGDWVLPDVWCNPCRKFSTVVSTKEITTTGQVDAVTRDVLF